MAVVLASRPIILHPPPPRGSLVTPRASHARHALARPSHAPERIDHTWLGMALEDGWGMLVQGMIVPTAACAIIIYPSHPAQLV